MHSTVHSAHRPPNSTGWVHTQMTKLSVTIPEAVAMTGIGRSSIYKLFRERKLTARKRGKTTLILVAELEHYVTSLPIADMAEAA